MPYEAKSQRKHWYALLLAMASLNSVELKIFRAARHIQALQAELEGYFKGNPGKMVREPNTPDDVAVFTFRSPGPIPARFGLIIGDCLQNLRSSLDYLVWELVLVANKQPTKNNMFPICSTRERFQEAVDKRDRLLGIAPEAVALIESLQPYHLGQDFEKATLLVLDDLANINKHRRILLTDLCAGTSDRRPFERNGELGIWIGPGAMPVFDSNTRFGPYPIVDGKVQMETQLVAVIAFAEGAAKGMEVSLCLNEWASYIKTKIVPMFEKFF